VKYPKPVIGNDIIQDFNIELYGNIHASILPQKKRNRNIPPRTGRASGGGNTKDA
jgi:hypothetical protein